MDMYDTLKYAKKLIATGIPQNQAEAQIEIMSDLVDKNFATNASVEKLGNDVRSEMRELGTELRSEIKELGVELRSEIKELGVELRSEMRELGTQLRSEMKELRTQLRSEMQVMGAEITRDLTIRMGAMMAFSTTITIAILSLILHK
jgi:gas vesicle protein